MMVEIQGECFEEKGEEVGKGVERSAGAECTAQVLEGQVEGLQVLCIATQNSYKLSTTTRSGVFG